MRPLAQGLPRTRGKDRAAPAGGSLFSGFTLVVPETWRAHRSSRVYLRGRP